MYVLIVVLVFSQKATSVTAEFDTRQACLDAASALRAQVEASSSYERVYLCAAKGPLK